MKISEIIESRGHKIIATKLKDVERQKKFASGELEIPTPAQRKNYDDSRDTVKDKKVKEALPTGNDEEQRRKLINYIIKYKDFESEELSQLPTKILINLYKEAQQEKKDWINRRADWYMRADALSKEKGIDKLDALRQTPHDLDTTAKQSRLKFGEETDNQSNIDSSKVHKLLWSLSGYLKKAMPDVEIDQRSGGKVWTRGDGTRYRDPARLVFNDVSTRDQAFDLLSKALTGARRTTVSGEHGGDDQQDALVWKGKVIAKKGSFGISLGAASRITNPNSVWREKPVKEDSTVYKLKIVDHNIRDPEETGLDDEVSEYTIDVFDTNGDPLGQAEFDTYFGHLHLNGRKVSKNDPLYQQVYDLVWGSD